MRSLALLVLNLLRKLLFLWVRTRILPEDLSTLERTEGRPVVYVLQDDSLSARLVLEQSTRDSQLPSSWAPLMHKGRLIMPHSYFYLFKRLGGWITRRRTPVIPKDLKHMVRVARMEPDFDCDIVPVSVFWGQAPEKEKSLLKLLLSDTWTVTGPIKKFFIILLHGRNTLVQFSKPVSLQSLIEDCASPEQAQRKVARILRVHFRAVRQAVIGPDLSHRRTLVNQLIKSPPVKAAIQETASKEKIPVAKAEARALKYADEIASNISIATIRFLEILLTWVWNKIYNGVQVNGLARVKSAAEQGAVVYVPCHRSHIDYLLLSYVLYENGLSVPHIAAGINLNMPIVGGILRRGGAFFMRRSFKNNKLYAAVFNEYMHSIFTRGYPMEYFVEGGRSRTGRTLPPRAGMLLMTVRSYLRDHRKPITFVPVYIGYEKVMEARTYLGELKGKKKEKENILTLIRSIRNLRNNFGQVSLNFGEPFQLATILDDVHPDWKQETWEPDSRPEWLPRAVDRLATEIATRINNAAALNPVNMLATALHATPNQAMDERILKDQLKTLTNLLRSLPYSQDMTFPNSDPETWVDYCEGMGIVYRQKQKLGDIILMDDLNAILTTYYRNNVLHLMALPAMVACLFENNATVNRERAVWLVSATYPYVRSELFMRWSDTEVDAAIEQWIDVLIQHGLLSSEGDQLYRPLVGSREAVLLSMLAQVIIPTLERYYIAIAILRKHGSGTLTAGRLEELSTLMAERMSILYGLNAPEFFDKTLFRNFISLLKARGLLSVNEEGLLAYSEEIEEVADAARFVLDPAIRQSILTITTQAETD